MLTQPPLRGRAWLLLLFPIFYLLAMSRFALTYVRNMIVILPFLAILTGYGIDMVVTQVSQIARTTLASRSQANAGEMLRSRRVWNALRWTLIVAALTLVAWEPLRISAALSSYMNDPDSRTLAWTWMRDQIGQGKRFAAELHPWQVQSYPDVLAFDVENPESQNPLTARPPQWYAERGYDYVVLNSNYKLRNRDKAIWAEYEKLPKVREYIGDGEGPGGKGPNITIRATGAKGLPVLNKSGAQVESFALLSGYDLAPLTATNTLLDPISPPPEETYRPGGAVGLNLYYLALRDGTDADTRWQVWIHMVDPSTGAKVAQLDVQPLTGQNSHYPNVVRQPWPVSRWHKGELVSGIYNFDIPSNVSPGTYRIETGMWVPPNGPSANVTYPDPPPAPGVGMPSDRITLGVIEVQP